MPKVIARVLAAGLLGWFFVTCCAHHPGRRIRWAEALDRRRVLIPDWRFYAPEPMVHDHYILCRDLVGDAATTWRRLTSYPQRRLSHALWNPDSRAGKAVADAAGRTILAAAAGVPIAEINSYRLLVNYVCRNVPHAEGAVATQFVVLRSAGYDAAEKPRVLIRSPMIELAPAG
ncbi:hypothetical protein [Amycolatopsis sp. lyj-108]|uniref:hypothetical protein n=1 Tax=Amycolatopsis sp. lyj-108 TaxID=2789286 RepID=UPI00397BD756